MTMDGMGNGFHKQTQVELESPRCSSQMHSMLGSAMCCVCHRLPRVGSFGAVWGFYSKNIRTRWAPTSCNYNSTCRGEITPVPSFIRPFMGVIIPCITSRDRRKGRFMCISGLIFHGSISTPKRNIYLFGSSEGWTKITVFSVFFVP